VQPAERAAYQSILTILKEQQEYMQHLGFRIGSREGEGHDPLEATQALNGAVQKLEAFLLATEQKDQTTLQTT
jgi:hypothetical protein